MDMPRHDELAEERSSLLQLEEAKIEGLDTPAAVAPPVLVPAVGAAVMMEQQASSTQTILQQVAENQRRSQELTQKAQNSKGKLSLLQKRSKLRQLKEKLAADKAKLAVL